MPRIKKPKKPKKPKKEGGMYRLGHQMGLYVTGQADTWRPPSSASLQPPGLQDPTDVFQTDIASPAYQSEQIEYENARKMDAEARKKAREDMIARINHRRSGSGRPITQLDTGPLTGSGMSAPLLKEFIDLSYRGNTSIAPAGWSIDAPLSDSRVKVYAKNGSNDKNIVVTHRGSVGLDDWMDNASYMFRGKVKGTKTYNLHRDRHKRAIDKYGASNITAIGHSRAGLYLQELQKEFPIKENITYNKASGFHDIGRQNDANQTDVRVGNDIVSLLAPLQRRNNAIVNISGTKNPFDFNAAHQTAEINKVGDQYIGKGRKRGRPRKIGGVIHEVPWSTLPPEPPPLPLTRVPPPLLARVPPLPPPPPISYRNPPYIPNPPRRPPPIYRNPPFQPKLPPPPPSPPTEGSPLTKEYVDYIISKMNPADVRKIMPSQLRDKIKELRAEPKGRDLEMLIMYSQMGGYDAARHGGSGRKRGRPRKVGGMTNDDTRPLIPFPGHITVKSTSVFYDWLDNQIYELDRYINSGRFDSPQQADIKSLLEALLRHYENMETNITNLATHTTANYAAIYNNVIRETHRLLAALYNRGIGAFFHYDTSPSWPYTPGASSSTDPYVDPYVTPGASSSTDPYVRGASGASGNGIGSSKNKVAPHDIQVVFPQYPPDRPVQIHPEPAPVPPPPLIPIQPRRPRQNFHSPQREKYSRPRKSGGMVSEEIINDEQEIENMLNALIARTSTPWRKLQIQNSNTVKELVRDYIRTTGKAPTGDDLTMICKGENPLPYPTGGPKIGEGTLPVISSVEGIKRLIATEQARLRKIKKGYKYESPTMSQEKIEEKIARLKERLKSAKANKGHADVSYFIPKSIKWLKIMADETRVGSDAYNKELLEAVKKLLAELSGKKPTAANKKKTATLEEDRDELEKIIGKKKKGYSKKTPDANKPAPVIIPPSSLTNERANIRAAVERGRTYNKIIDDKQQEDFKVILKAMIPDPEPAQRTKEEIRKERAREAARRQRERDKPSGFTQAQEYNKATKQRQAKAKEYGIPTREYTASLKREAQLKKIEEGLEDEEKKKVIREERNKLKAKYTYLDEIMNSDNTDANIANTSSMGEQPVLVEAEVEPPTAPLDGSGMCGGGLSNDPKFVISGKNEEYKLLY
jgi:hypothetical protein